MRSRSKPAPSAALADEWTWNAAPRRPGAGSEGRAGRRPPTRRTNRRRTKIKYRIKGAYESKVDVTWLKDAAVENGPIPLGARALATRMRDLGTGCER